MEILLISANQEQIPYPVAPLGLAYVAAPLLKKKHDVVILDLCFVEDVHSILQYTIKKLNPDIIGLSIRNTDNLTYPGSIFYLDDIKKIVNLLKTYTDAFLILGGSGFSLFPEEILRYLDLYVGIVGDGEMAFKRLANRLSKKKNIYNIPNLVYIKQGCFYQNPTAFSQDFSLPARYLLDNKKYLKLGGMANIQTKKGCPFKCIYCTYPFLNGNRIRYREPVDVVDELEEMEKKYNIDHVFFVDDIFNHPLEHAFGICEEIIKRSIRLKWTCFVTPAEMTLDLVRLMKKAGCEGVEFGTDAAFSQGLINLGKPFTVDEIVKVSEFCDKIGLESAHYLLLGGPGETLDTLMDTIALMEKINPGAVIAMIGVRIYPNTKLRDISIREGIIGEDDNLLEPRFYISPMVEEKEFLLKVGKYATSKANWIVPGLGIRYSPKMLDVLRRLSERGPLWNILGQHR